MFSQVVFSVRPSIQSVCSILTQAHLNLLHEVLIRNQILMRKRNTAI